MIVICKFILKTIPKTISIDAIIKELQNEKERLEQSVLSLQKDYLFETKVVCWNDLEDKQLSKLLVFQIAFMILRLEIKNVKFCSAIIVDVSSLYFENYHRTRIEKSQNKSQKI